MIYIGKIFNFLIVCFIFHSLIICSHGLDYYISTLAGSGVQGSSVDGVVSQGSPIGTSKGVWSDSNRVYFTDEDASKVRTVDSTKILGTLAGGGFGSYGGQATSTALSSPVGIWGSGNTVHFSDNTLNMVFSVDLFSGILSLFGGLGSSTAFSGDGVAATSSNFYSPYGICGDGIGSVYVAVVSMHRVLKVTNSIVTSVAGNGDVGSSIDGGQATAAALGSVYGLSVDTISNVYIYESPYRIRRIVSSGIITSFVGTGSSSASNDGLQATSTDIGNVIGIWANTDGNVFYSDYDWFKTKVVSSNGIVTTIAGTGFGGLAGNYGPATSAALACPAGVYGSSTSSTIYVCDQCNFMIHAVLTTIPPTPLPTISPTVVLTVTPTVIPSIQPSVCPTLGPTGRPTFTPVVAPVCYSINRFAGTSSGDSGDNGPASSASLNSPYYYSYVFVDSQGSTYISDGTYRVRKVSPSGIIFAFFGVVLGGSNSGDGGKASVAFINYPAGVWADSAGRVFVMTTSYCVRMVDSSSIVTTYAGKGGPGSSGDGGQATAAKISMSYGIAGDSVGNIYFSDAENYKIRKVIPNGIISTIAGGIYGVGGENIQATASAFSNNIYSLVVDTNSILYYGDSARVRTINSAAIISTVSGMTTSGASGSDGLKATSSKFLFVLFLWVDSSGAIFISDFLNFNIRVVVSNSLYTVSGTGEQSLSYATGFATSSSLSAPNGIFGDFYGNVLITDDYVVRKLTPVVFTGMPSFMPTEIPSVLPTESPSLNPSILPTLAPTSSSLPTTIPSCSPSMSPTILPSLEPTVTPTVFPSLTPSTLPSVAPSTLPSVAPSIEPSNSPSIVPSNDPTETPSMFPSMEPTFGPTDAPSDLPTERPTQFPSVVPSEMPTEFPSQSPSEMPTTIPSVTPSTLPSQEPTFDPTVIPSNLPTVSPTVWPSQGSSELPTTCPSVILTIAPSNARILITTVAPSEGPIAVFTVSPSVVPTETPSVQPSTIPTAGPSLVPSLVPSLAPSLVPSVTPSIGPSIMPTLSPTIVPTVPPSIAPTLAPSVVPTLKPSIRPSVAPSLDPTHLHLMCSSLPNAEEISVDVPYTWKLVLPMATMSVGRVGNAFTSIGTDLPSQDESSLYSSSRNGNVTVNVVTYVVSSESIFRSAETLNDVNGDGVIDLIIGDPFSSKVYVLFGNNNGLVHMSEGFTIFGEQDSDMTGWSVSDAGDVNNDTLSDIIIGAPMVKGIGAIYVVYGRRASCDVYLNDLNTTTGYRIYGSQKADFFGVSVSEAGDVNGDGFDDIIVGSVLTAKYFSGGVLVLYGGTSTPPRSVALFTALDGYTIVGSSYSYTGCSVSGAKDVNGDEFDDVIIGSNSQKASVKAEVFLLLGTKRLRSNTLLSTLTSDDVIHISGSGLIVSGVDDYNNDGLGDFIVVPKCPSAVMGCLVKTSVSSMTVVTRTPTVLPSNRVTLGPTICPTTRCPSIRPSRVPSINPTMKPSPTEAFTSSPTNESVIGRSFSPSTEPSEVPTVVPSHDPTEAPSEIPSTTPTNTKSEPPSVQPSETPTNNLVEPTLMPSEAEVISTTRRPFTLPTLVPSVSALSNQVHINGGSDLQDQTTGSKVYFVNTADEVSVYNALGNNTYVVSPYPGSLLIIQFFNVTSDRIDLTSFTSITVFSQLLITSGSVIITLPSEQIVRIMNLHPSDINGSCFVFYEDAIIPEHNSVVEHFSMLVGIAIGIGGIVWLLFVACPCVSVVFDIVKRRQPTSQQWLFDIVESTETDDNSKDIAGSVKESINLSDYTIDSNDEWRNKLDYPDKLLSEVNSIDLSDHTIDSNGEWMNKQADSPEVSDFSNSDDVPYADYSHFSFENRQQNCNHVENEWLQDL